MQISVVMPCHNAARWIEAALQSIAAQTRAPLEVVVVDDASSDDSRGVVERARPLLEERGVEVVVLPAQVFNAGRARNIGIEAARGDWIAFLDADDIWFPGHLEDACALLERSDDVAFLAGFEALDLKGQTSPLSPLSLGQTQNGLAPGAFLKVLVNFDPFGHSNVMYRRERVLEVGGFDAVQTRVHDMDLWLRVIRDHTFCFDAKAHSAYRMDTPGSVSKNRVSRQFFCLRMLLKNRDLFDQNQDERDAMTGLVQLNARQALSLALFEGNRADVRLAKPLAWPHLSPAFRAAFVLSASCLPLARAALKLSRRVRG